MITGIDGEHREPGRRHPLDIRRSLEVIGIGAPGLLPPLFDHRPRGGVDDLIRGAFGAFELADRLLGEHDPEPAISQCPQVGRPGDAEAVAEAERVGET
jgi:hypothetical protein